MTINDALQRFLRQLRADGRSHHTLKQYERHVRVLAGWMAATGRGEDLAGLGHEDVAEFFTSDAARLTADGRPKSSGSMNAMRTSIRCFLGYLHAAGELPSNPARLLRRALTGRRPPRPLPDEDCARLFTALDAGTSAADRRDRMLVRLLLRTGIRIGSAVGLAIEDLDLDRGEMTLRGAKGDREVTAYLPDEIADELRAFLAGRTSGPVFLAHGIQRLGVRHAQRRFAAWLERAGIDQRATPHSLRHSFATRLMIRTGDIALVQAALGHRSVESTLIYARTPADRIRAAI